MSEDVVTFVILPAYVDRTDPHQRAEYYPTMMRAYPSLTRAVKAANQFVIDQGNCQCDSCKSDTQNIPNATGEGMLRHVAVRGPWRCEVYMVTEISEY